MNPKESQPEDFAALFTRLIAAREQYWILSARRYVRDEHLARDVVQDTLARVWKRCAASRPANLQAYVDVAVRYNALRQLARQATPTLPLEQEPAAPTMGEDDPVSIDPLTLEQAISSLPAGQQAVIRMKYYTGMTFRQIAQHLSIPLHTAASRCRSALAQLRRDLSKTPNALEHEETHHE